jgi:REP element-mobilizing transposase RayT
MATARTKHISLEATPYYHCVSRCVRKAFLCGYDQTSDCDFEHRRGWLEDKLLELQQYFCIDICAYAVMSNHYHVVLHVDKGEALGLSEKEVVVRWHGMFQGTLLTQQFAQGKALGKAEYKAVQYKIKEWRKRLMDISWFIRCANEWIARQANHEDNCTGRFWEGRFKSQALLDEKALAACMVYVDLNPLRAKMSTTPEASEYTSIKKRALQAKKSVKKTLNPNYTRNQVSDLMPFAGNPKKDIPKGLPFKLRDYIELLDWTGRQARKDKGGSISESLPPILSRLNIPADNWMVASCYFESRFKGLVGARTCLIRACENLSFLRVVGLGASRLLN